MCATRPGRESAGSRRRRPRRRRARTTRRARATSSGSSPSSRCSSTETSCAPRLQSAFSSSRILPRLSRLRVDVVEVARARPSRRSPSACATPGWYSSRCPTISTRSGRARPPSTTAVGLGRRLRQRLLDEAVLAGLQDRAARAARATGTSVATTTASSSGSASSSSSSAVKRVPGKRARQRSRASASSVAAPAQLAARRARRSCAPGSAPSSRGPTTPTVTLSRSAITGAPGWPTRCRA